MKGPVKAEDIGPEVVRSARSGDPAALRILVKGAYPLVRRWALVQTGDPTEADDLTQDVMIQVIRHLDGFEGTARFTTWLYSVTRNAAADRLRRRGRRTRHLHNPRLAAEVAPADAGDPSAGADLRHIREVVEAFFTALPQRQREVFDMAELQGMPAAEIAERLGIEPVSVRAHLFKARRALRGRILAAHPELGEEWP